MRQAPRQKILLLIPHLGGGGAERVFLLLARNLSPSKYEIHLCLVTQNGIGEVELPHSVRVHGLGARRVLAGTIPLLKLIWRVRPAVILSGMAHLNFLLLSVRHLLPRRTRLLVRQNGTASSMLAESTWPQGLEFLYRTLYPKAHVVVCQSQAMVDDLAEVIGRRNWRHCVLRNPVDIASVRLESSSNASPGRSRGPKLVAVGRLSPEKGFDLLIEAMAEVLGRFPDAELWIAGSGMEEQNLRKLVSSLGLGVHVHFAGQVLSPAILFSNASLFVLPSRHEGIANALLEAAAAGLPIVATPASRGLVDLLKDDRGSWVARDHSVAALAETLLTALSQIGEEQRFFHSWIEPFSLCNSVAAYERVLDDALAWASS